MLRVASRYLVDVDLMLHCSVFVCLLVFVRLGLFCLCLCTWYRSVFSFLFLFFFFPWNGAGIFFLVVVSLFCLRPCCVWFFFCFIESIFGQFSYSLPSFFFVISFLRWCWSCQCYWRWCRCLHRSMFTVLCCSLRARRLPAALWQKLMFIELPLELMFTLKLMFKLTLFWIWSWCWSLCWSLNFTFFSS